MFMLIYAKLNTTGGPLTHTREIFSPVNTFLEVAEQETSECDAAVSSLNWSSTPLSLPLMGSRHYGCILAHKQKQFSWDYELLCVPSLCIQNKRVP